MNAVQIELAFNKKFLSEAAAVQAVAEWVNPIQQAYPDKIVCRFMVAPILTKNKNTGDTIIRYGVILFALNKDITQVFNMALQSGFNVMN